MPLEEKKDEKMRKIGTQFLANAKRRTWRLADFGSGTLPLTTSEIVRNEDNELMSMWIESLDEALADSVGKCSRLLHAIGFFDADAHTGG